MKWTTFPQKNEAKTIKIENELMNREAQQERINQVEEKEAKRHQHSDEEAQTYQEDV